MKTHGFLCWVIFALLGLAGIAWAQDTASLTGTVTDPSGAAVANAQVSVTNSEHGVNRTAPSNGSGEYTFAALPIGSYDLTVTADGFKKYEAKGITLNIAEKARVNVTLHVGAVNTEVIVQGSEVAQVQTQSAELGGTITGKEISQLELNGRDYTQLVALSPGVTNQSGSDEGETGASTVAFSINGGRTEYNNFEVDGGDSQDNGSNTTLNVYPSIDAIAEVQVLTSNYGAQYGRNGSGTVEVETKSGTSSFHGDLYEFIRNDAFNATQFGLTSVPAYKKHDFGFTIGGPVYIPGHYNTSKQKTFFFWSEEWRRELVPGTNFFSTTFVPTMSDRTGDFTDQCPNLAGSFAECPSVPGYTNAAGYTPNLNVVPAFASNQVIDQALTAMIPQPNLSSGDTPTPDQWLNPPTLPTHWRQELFKIDHNINDKVRVSFRYIHDSWNQQYPVPLWTSGTSFPTIQTSFSNPGVSMVAHLTATITPTLLNEFVASYTTDHISTALTGPWAQPTGFPTIGLFNNGLGGKVPGISLADSEYTFAEDPGYVPQGPLNSNPTFTFRDNVTKVAGLHNLQFGIYVVNAHKNEIPQPSYGVNGLLQFSNTGNTVTTGNAYADLLLGNVGTYTQEQNAFKMHEAFGIFEGYFQDDWHIRPRLTLNLGIRLSGYGRYREENKLAWNFDPAFYAAGTSSVDPTTGLVVGNPYNGWVDCGVTPGVPAGCMTNRWWNPAPRIGFAFDPKGDGRWAIRGGYGIFFEHTNGNEANTESLEQYNINTQTTSVVNVAGYNNLTPALLGGGTTPLTFVSLPSKAKWPYVQQWHFDLQHDLGKGTVATIGYVGSAGVHLTRSYQYNQMQPVPLSQNPYSPGQVINAGPLAQNPLLPSPQFDCSWGPGNDQPGVTLDAYGVPTNAITSYGTPVPYTPGVSGGPPSGAAVNLFVACGNNPNFFLPFAGIGSIERKDQTGSSNYNALEATIRHNIGGLELNAAYTYSHSIDDSSDYNDLGFVNSYNLNAYRSSSDYDQRHNITIAYVYDFPYKAGRGFSHELLGGWQWSGITLIQSGSPFSVYNLGNGTIAPEDNAGVSNGLATGSSYPDVVGNPKEGTSSSALAGALPGFGPLLYNPGAFVAPTGLTFGDAGRNILRNPWRENFDMALIKHFPVTESKYFEFRAEAFNAFNHTEYSWLGGDAGSAADNSNGGGKTPSDEVTCYGGPNNSAGDSTCAGNPLFRAGSAHLARILQFGLKFIF
ncbi:MAG TPA: carboxypeptidase regulatory-like domain-containing protein [Candidatus Binatia bacterium]|nr:carboxypeptidase regulatory-like domain-containing protein [Candidatus Binatia bacterium]